jgi:cation diffusion facilitator CzcD-associated flavoprotein CzcO
VPAEDRSTTHSRVTVIGAGPAGLAVAAAVKRRGLPVTVLERGESVGSAWRAGIANRRLDTPRWAAALPGARLPRRSGPWVSSADYADHLDDYARRNGVSVRTGIEVERVRRERGFVLDTSAGAVRSSWVVVATGAAGEPRWPHWPSRGAFPGRVLHGSSYRYPDPFRGLDVLVVGPGDESAAIASDLADDGVRRVRLALGTAPQIVPRRFAGVSAATAATALRRLPVGAADRAFAAALRWAYGDLSPLGLPAPAEALSAAFARTGVAPIVDAGFVEHVRRGEIQVVPPVVDVDADGARLDDGALIRPDVIIAATGARPGLEALVGHLGVLDDDGEPVATGTRSDPAVPGLHFAGFRRPPIGALRAIRREALDLAAAIAPADPYDERWGIRPAPDADLTRSWAST